MSPHLVVGVDPGLVVTAVVVMDAKKYNPNKPGEALVTYKTARTSPGDLQDRIRLHRNLAIDIWDRYGAFVFALVGESQFYTKGMRDPYAIAACGEILGGWEFIFANVPIMTKLAPSTWQGGTLGPITGKTTKDKSLRRFKRLCGYDTGDHNIADAFNLTDYFMRELPSHLMPRNAL